MEPRAMTIGWRLEPWPTAFNLSWNQDYCVEATVGFVAAVGVDNGSREEVGLGMK